MSVSLGVKVQFTEYDNTSLLTSVFANDQPTFASGLTKTVNSGKLVADESTGAALDFGPVTTASLIYVASDQDVTVNIDGQAVAVLANGYVLVAGSDATAITVDNDSGADANISYYIAGV